MAGTTGESGLPGVNFDSLIELITDDPFEIGSGTGGDGGFGGRGAIGGTGAEGGHGGGGAAGTIQLVGSSINGVGSLNVDGGNGSAGNGGVDGRIFVGSNTVVAGSATDTTLIDAGLTIDGSKPGNRQHDSWSNRR